MKQNRFDRHLVEKLWGSEEWLINNDKYCGKILYLNKDKKCSVHNHKLKDELFFVNKGCVLLRYIHIDDIKLIQQNNQQNEALIFSTCAITIILNPGDSFHIKPGLVHQFYGYEDSEIFEFSTHHSDEDVYRIIPSS